MEEEKIQESPEEGTELKEKISKISEKMKANPWMVVSAALGLILIVFTFLTFSGITGHTISGDDAGQRVLDFAASRGIDTEIVEVNQFGSLYEVVLDIEGQQAPVYVTQDGEFLVSQPIPLTADVVDTSQQQPSQDVPKSDKPKVELFVMTHCPYGTQAEKGFLPAIEALGNTIDAKIEFVHYYLHEPEYAETPIQVCIREEYSSKFIPYLECFLEAGETDKCISKVGLNKAVIDKCAEEKGDNYYSVDSQLSEGYGVQGSPTLVVNGVIVNSGRSPSAYLQTICSAFNDAPDACDLELDTTNPSAGFGYNAGTAASAAASC